MKSFTLCPLARRFASVALLGCVLLALTAPAKAQYPYISPEIKHEADARRAAADAHSDQAFAKAMKEILAGEARGKPYLPWAAEPKDLPQASLPAFPGAEGGGMYSFGGRGGKIFVVTSLEDSGRGSLREALEAGGARIIVFNVSGIIRLKSRIRVRAPYVTLAGSTAPGDGVCIAGDTVELETHDVIIRHMRFRRGETWVGDRNDSLGGNPIGNIMIDHVSASWGLDENMSMYRHMYQPPSGGPELKLPTVNITIQNSIFSEGLNTYHHAFGSTIGGLNSTFHRNLWANNTGRNPSVGMYGDFTFVNNVLYNWVHRTVDGGDHRSFFNIINNYLKPGPATPVGRPIAWRLLKPESERSKTVFDHFGKAYVNGNVVEGNARVTRDNWDGGVQPESRADPATVLPAIRNDNPFPHAKLTMLSAREAYETVLNAAGATRPKRDAVDLRIVQDVRSGKASSRPFDGSREAYRAVRYGDKAIDEIIRLVDLGIITDPSQVGGYPDYKG
ncbi:MAG: hypothetical protein KBA71_12350, partial [Opitutaceae bacterium]|nr:hypothetical protein [Opitutaceae bacterium]